MIRNYIIITIRKWRNRPLVTLLNIGGLAVGLTASLLIILYLAFEYSYDTFHKNADNLYRVRFDRFYPDRHDRSIGTCPAFAPALEKAIPEVKAAIRVKNIDYMSNVITSADHVYNQDKIFFADKRFFEIFSFPLITQTADPLKQPYTAVLTQSTAEKYFGSSNVLGRTFELTNDFGKQLYEVTGVAKDPPQNSHLKFKVLLSFESLRKQRPDIDNTTGWNAFYTYVLLKKGVNPGIVEAKFDRLIKDLYDDNSLKMAYYLQPLKDIHLHSDFRQEAEPGSSALADAVLLGVAIFILFIAWANYINLTTSTGIERAREIGLRKTLGSNKKELLKQFFVESALLNLAAIILTGIILEIILPFFSNFVSAPLNPGLLFKSDLGVLLMSLFPAGVILSGLIPAIMFIGMRPSQVLKGGFFNATKGWRLRKVLIITQFTLSVAAISATLIIRDQVAFMLSHGLGMDIDHVLVLKTPRRIENTAQKINVLKTSLLAQSAVKSVCFSSIVPGRENTAVGGGARLAGQDKKMEKQCYSVLIDYNFPETYGIKLLAGRLFSKEFASDSDAVILNKQAADLLGFSSAEVAINQQVINPQIRSKQLRIIGVINNYHQQSLQNMLNPTMFYLIDAAAYISVKLQGGHLKQTINDIRMQWQKVFPGEPFDTFFLDDAFRQQYNKDIHFGRIFTLFSLLSVCIACLGLFGLVAFSARQKTKEIGVRKVLGAGISSIFLLISQSYFRLILIAVLLAAPFTYMVMENWLQNYAFKIEISSWVFVLSAGISIVFALLTVSFQAVRAAMANPVESLRYE